MSVCLQALLCKSYLYCTVLCCHLQPVWLCHIFSTLSHKRHDFRKKKSDRTYNACFEVWALLGFYATSVRNYHSTLRNIAEQLRSHLHRGGRLKSHTCVLIFSTTFVYTIVILRRIQWNAINVLRSSCKVPVILVRFFETWIFWTGFRKKFPNIKFHKKLSSGSRVVPCGETDGPT